MKSEEPVEGGEVNVLDLSRHGFISGERLKKKTQNTPSTRLFNEY